jgi:hypothetical protein
VCILDFFDLLPISSSCIGYIYFDIFMILIY